MTRGNFYKRHAIAPCPFCGTKLDGYATYVSEDKKTAYVKCDSCQAKGPEVDVEDAARRAAVRAWRIRRRIRRRERT